MTAREPWQEGDDWFVNRDPDEKSHYAADITQELIDRATTAKTVVLNLTGVVQLEEPQIQVAAKDGVQRTYVVAFLGGTGSAPPADWRWEARVTCANLEEFDKTTHFKRKDT